MEYPILYSFIRCPYAMRARMALKLTNTKCEIREVRLNNKPKQMIDKSPKGTVPVLVLQKKVIDESNDIIEWALSSNNIFDGNIDHDQINLTINLNVQNHLENILEDAIIKYDAEASFGIILNVNNGEIIAMTSLPDFDPNASYEQIADKMRPINKFNRNTLGVYEFGSVMKIFTTAIGIEENIFHPNSKLIRNIVGGTSNIPKRYPTIINAHTNKKISVKVLVIN